MGKITVLGIGNQLMMDDGIGIIIVEELKKHGDFSEIDFWVGESDIDYCLEKIDGSTLVLIIDAVISRKNPGEITIYSFSELHEQQPLNISPHNFHLFQALYHQKEVTVGYLIGVEPYEIKFHLGLSDTLEKNKSQILDEVKARIKTIAQKNPV